MPDLGRVLEFGVSLPNPASQAAMVVRLAQLAEQHGLDLIGVQDHPYNAELLDTWTLLANLAAATDVITLFPDVLCLPLRPPAVLARSVASLDLLSGGRIELGVGAGRFLEATAGMGGGPLSRAESVDALEEAIGVIRAVWTAQDPITLNGRFHRLDHADPGPRPAHDVGIWVGAARPRMLSLAARLGDGWIASQSDVSPPEAGRLNREIDLRAKDAGRDPADIGRIYNVSGRFGPHERGFLDGPAVVWAEQLTELVLQHGFSTFVLGVSGDIIAAISRFADEVVPDVRERVATERSLPQGRTLAGAIAIDRAESISMADAGALVAGADAGGVERDGNWGTAGGLPVADRPRAAALSAAAEAHPAAADNHRNLVAIHDHLRSELVQIGQAVNQVAAGELPPGEARSLISRMTLRQNHWTLGSFCASYCRIVTIHHAVEDTHMFPGLAAVAPSLQSVLDRLEAEHLVIAEVLERFDRALVDLVRETDGSAVPSSAGTAEINALAGELGDVLLSHLAYEEDELMEGLALMPRSI
jgi:hypothetical protein